MNVPVVLAHAPADHDCARYLADFLELGCDVRCDLQAGQLRPNEHILDLVEHCQEHLVLLPWTRLHGAGLSLALISGAIFFHVASPLGLPAQITAVLLDGIARGSK